MCDHLDFRFTPFLKDKPSSSDPKSLPFPSPVDSAIAILHLEFSKVIPPWQRPSKPQFDLPKEFVDPKALTSAALAQICDCTRRMYDPGQLFKSASDPEATITSLRDLAEDHLNRLHEPPHVLFSDIGLAIFRLLRIVHFLSRATRMEPTIEPKGVPKELYPQVMQGRLIKRLGCTALIRHTMAMCSAVSRDRSTQYPNTRVFWQQVASLTDVGGVWLAAGADVDVSHVRDCPICLALTF
jgi:hypothetical protein